MRLNFPDFYFANVVTESGKKQFGHDFRLARFTATRCLLRNSRRNNRGSERPLIDSLQSAHIRLERFRNNDTAVFLLIVL